MSKDPGWSDLLSARERISGHVHRTPVLTSRHLDALAGAELHFKCENLQRTGSFKARGACNAVFSLDDAAASRGVVTHSSGNHGQAVAYAASRRGIRAIIIMPENAPEAKQAAAKAYGGEVVLCRPGLASREAAVARVQAETGAVLVHPYADSAVIAGQGSAAAELIEEAGALDALIVPVSGGGLISGSCIAAAQLAPALEVHAAEPELADDVFRSLSEGRLVTGEDSPATIADGLRGSMKEINWRYVSRHVRSGLVCSEAEIVAAMRLIFERMKLVVEPSGAVPLAALLRARDRFAGRRVGILLSGGNVDLNNLPWQR